MGQLGRRGQDLADRASQEGLAKGGGTVHVNPDGSIDIDPASGQVATVNGDFDVTGTITGTINVSQLQLEDDEQLQFGDAPDYWQEYESANTRWRMRSADVDGVGTAGDIARVDDGQQAMDFLATPTVSGTALVQESRSLTGGNAIDAIGDLSADRTIAVSSNGIQTDELDLSIAPTWTGQHTFNADMTLAQPSNNYLVTSADGTLALQNQATGTTPNVSLFAFDGDGTDTVRYRLFGVGTPGAITDSEQVTIEYNSAGRGAVYTSSAGAGSSRPMHLYAAGNVSQIVARTDGNVAMSGSLKVGGTGAANKELEVFSSGNTFLQINTSDTTDGFSQVSFASGGTERYQQGYTHGNSRYRLATQDSDGSGTFAEVFRVPDGQLTVDFNATTDENAFDEYEDYKLARAARVSMMPDEAELRKRHADLLREYRPVLEKSGMVKWDEDGTPFIGAQKMMMFQLDGLFQVGTQVVENRQHLREVDRMIAEVAEKAEGNESRIEELERENERLRGRVHELEQAA